MDLPEYDLQLDKLEDDASIAAFNSWLLEGDDFTNGVTNSGAGLEAHDVFMFGDFWVDELRTNGDTHQCHSQTLNAMHEQEAVQVQYQQESGVVQWQPDQWQFRSEEQPHGHLGHSSLQTEPGPASKPATCANRSLKTNKATDLSVHQRYRRRKKQLATGLQAQLQTLRTIHESLTQDHEEQHARIGILDSLVKLTNEHVTMLTSMRQKNNPCTFCDALPEGPIKQYAKQAGFDRATPEVSSVAIYWRLLMSHFSEVLIEIETSNSSQHLHSLDELIEQTTLAFQQLMLFYPELALVGFGMNMQTCKPEVADVSHWQAALKGVKPSKEQLNSLNLCMQLMAQSMARLDKERSLIIADFSKLSITSNSTGAGSNQYINTISEAEEALKRLKSSTAKQQVISAMLLLYMKRVLTNVQKAKFMVLMYPFMPDAVGMCKAMMSMNQEQLSAGCSD